MTVIYEQIVWQNDKKLKFYIKIMFISAAIPI